MVVAMLDIATSRLYLGWSAGLFIFWGVFLVLVPKSRYFSEGGTVNAHHLCCIVPNIYLALSGVHIWFFDTDFANIFSSDKLNPFYGPANDLALVMCAYQTWDFIVCLVTPELRKPESLAHHGATIFGCVVCVTQCWALYFAVFFAGVSEVSSVPLAFMDLLKTNESLKAKFKAADEAIPVVFALLFLTLRVLYWPYVAFQFSEGVLASGASVPLQIASHALNLGLLSLQWFWGYLIIRIIAKTIKGSPRDADATNREPLLSEAVADAGRSMSGTIV